MAAKSAKSAKSWPQAPRTTFTEEDAAVLKCASNTKMRRTQALVEQAASTTFDFFETARDEEVATTLCNEVIAEMKSFVKGDHDLADFMFKQIFGDAADTRLARCDLDIAATGGALSLPAARYFAAALAAAPSSFCVHHVRHSTSDFEHLDVDVLRAAAAVLGASMRYPTHLSFAMSWRDDGADTDSAAGSDAEFDVEEVLDAAALADTAGPLTSDPKGGLAALARTDATTLAGAVFNVSKFGSDLAALTQKLRHALLRHAVAKEAAEEAEQEEEEEATEEEEEEEEAAEVGSKRRRGGAGDAGQAGKRPRGGAGDVGQSTK